MGLGPPVIALYHQLKALGLFNEVSEVMELGSQNVWCPQTKMMRDLFTAFGRPIPPETMVESFANWTGSARDLYEGLGFKYNCVDTDGKFGALVLDINFDSVPADQKNKYDFVTNHGTTEHLINQLNAFRMIHDFTKPGGLILHALPFLGQVDHGFFNYQPNLFDALARYNSYHTLGMWLGIDWQLSSFIPWEPKLLEFLVLSPKSTGLLIVLQRKIYATEFQVPFQGMFEQTKTSDVSSRYAFVVDGEVYDGRRDKFVTKDSLIAEEVAKRVAEQVATLQSGMDTEVAKRVAEQVAALEKRPGFTFSRAVRQLLDLGPTASPFHASEFEQIYIWPNYSPLPQPLQWRGRLFEWVFGRYPRLNRNHAYWADLRHVVAAVNRVVKCEPLRRLFITSENKVASRLLEESQGFVVSVPVHIVQKRSLYRVSDPIPTTTLDAQPVDTERKPFDICFCELDFDSLMRLPDIVTHVKTAMRPGGKIIIFHLNVTYRPITKTELSLLLSFLPATESSAVYFSGFPPSLISRIARKLVRIAVDRREGRMVGVLIHAAVILLSVPFARFANRLAQQQPPSMPPQYWTSVTISIDVDASS